MRDTSEITPDLVTLDGPTWEATLGAVLDGVRDKLGLPPTTKLTAELHSMLVYGTGQFFPPHQDSEKADAMVGTLVVSLPSDSRAGNWWSRTAGRARRTGRRKRSCLLSRSTPTASTRSSRLTRVTASCSPQPARGQRDRRAGTRAVADLADCLAAHFSTPATRRYGPADLDPPTRLVYLLDHEYTERGLSWARLKGTDAERAALLRAAAEGCRL